MRQQSQELGQSDKRTRRREFLVEMGRMVSWRELVALVSPYMAEERRGRPPFPVEAMLPSHLMPQWRNLSDSVIEDALHDESTILRFRHVQEQHKVPLEILKSVNDLLQHEGLLLKTGTVGDATLITAPSSTKNASGERDSQTKQSKKGNQFYFRMMAHIGTDAESWLVHTVRGTAGNVNDVVAANSLLRSEESQAWSNAEYQGVAKRPEAKPRMHWKIATRPGKRKQLDPQKPIEQQTDKLKRRKASILVMVAHPFRVIKRRLGHMKMHYRGLVKNTTQLHTQFTPDYLRIVRRHLARAGA